MGSSYTHWRLQSVEATHKLAEQRSAVILQGGVPGAWRRVCFRAPCDRVCAGDVGNPPPGMDPYVAAHATIPDPVALRAALDEEERVACAAAFLFALKCIACAFVQLKEEAELRAHAEAEEEYFRKKREEERERAQSKLQQMKQRREQQRLAHAADDYDDEEASKPYAAMLGTLEEQNRQIDASRLGGWRGVLPPRSCGLVHFLFLYAAAMQKMKKEALELAHSFDSAADAPASEGCRARWPPYVFVQLTRPRVHAQQHAALE